MSGAVSAVLTPGCGGRGLHVEETHTGQQAATDTAVRVEAHIAPDLGLLPALQRGRRGAQHDGDAQVVRTPDGKVAGRVAGTILLFVGGSCSSSTTIRPSSGIDANTASRVPSTSRAWPVCAASHEAALRRCERAVQRDDGVRCRQQVGKAGREARFKLRGEVNLGHEHQHLAACRQRGLRRRADRPRSCRCLSRQTAGAAWGCVMQLGTEVIDRALLVGAEVGQNGRRGPLQPSAAAVGRRVDLRAGLAGLGARRETTGKLSGAVVAQRGGITASASSPWPRW